MLAEDPKPAAVQCIANLLDSPGGLKFYDGPAKPRDVMAAARANGVGVMGIRAVQAGALTAAIDRELPADHPEVRDYALAAGFRALCAEIGEDPAIVAHRYALGLPIDTLVLGVKNRTELAGCVAAARSRARCPPIWSHGSTRLSSAIDPILAEVSVQWIVGRARYQPARVWAVHRDSEGTKDACQRCGCPVGRQSRGGRARNGHYDHDHSQPLPQVLVPLI